jgi:hypothetical protein
MLTQSQHARLQNLTIKPWSGLLNYFRSMKADWDRLEELGYVTPRLVSTATYYGAEIWEYSITDAGRAALIDMKDGKHG